MATIQTKHGEFNAVDNGNGGTSLFVGDVKICEFPKVAWWNMDAIEKGIEQHREMIEKRIKERVTELNVTKENASDVIAKLIEVLGNDNKGFYSSRLKQCLNKLKVA